MNLSAAFYALGIAKSQGTALSLPLTIIDLYYFVTQRNQVSFFSLGLLLAFVEIFFSITRSPRRRETDDTPMVLRSERGVMIQQQQQQQQRDDLPSSPDTP